MTFDIVRITGVEARQLMSRNEDLRLPLDTWVCQGFETSPVASRQDSFSILICPYNIPPS